MSPIDMSPQVPSRISSTPPGEMEPARILVIEPEQGLRDQLVELMLHDGNQCLPLPSADGIMLVVDGYSPDLILLSLNMPGSSGFEICGEIRTSDSGRHLPVLLLTPSLADEHTIARALRAGADDCVCLDRPVELQARTSVHLRNKRYRDVLRRVRSERDNLLVKATVDPLTGVPNRRALEEAVNRQVAGRHRFGILFLDIDHFKRVNDNFGHDIGDHVLKIVADYMRRSTRVGDFCGRYGGEEFVILVAGADMEVTYRVAERHRDAVSRIPFRSLASQKHVTISIGVSVFDPTNPEDNAQAVVRRADEALYQAKKTGRNRVVRSTEVEASAIGGFNRDSVAPPAPAQSPSHSPSSSDIRMTIEVTTPSGEIIKTQTLPPIEAELLRQLNTGRSGLPVLPTIASEALRLANDPDSDVTKFALLVGKDPHFAARFLSLANSAIYSRGLKAASVRDAIVRIGLAGARDLLFQVVYATSAVGLPRFQTQVLRSYQRSVHSGIAARTVCRRLQQRYPFDYLSGLLHDIGESRIYRILATIPGASNDSKTVEDLVNRYHPKAGAELALAWQLPADIVDVCESHHEVGAESRLPVRVVMIADLVVNAAERPGFSNEPLPEETRLRELGMNADDMTFVIETVRAAMRGTKEDQAAVARPKV